MSQELKNYVDEFVRQVKPITDKRASIFKTLMSFVMDGQQWSDSEVKDRDGDTALTFNFSEDYVERFLARLFPRNPRTGVLEIGVKVYADEKNKAQKNAYEKEIMAVYSRSGIVTTLLEQGINCLVGGAACLYYPQDPILKSANIISLAPDSVYLGWTGNRLTKLAFDEYLGTSSADLANATGDTTFSGKKRRTYWDLQNFAIFEDDQFVKAGKNTLGEIPLSWIPFFPKPKTHEGRSKILSLYDLDREFNSAASDYSKRNSYNTDPERVIFSDNVGSKDAAKFSRGKKQTHFLGKDDDMRNLELQHGQEILDYLKMLDERLKQKTGIVGSAGSVKAAVSGFSLAYQYSDMMDLIGFMRIFWDEGLRKLNSAILTYKFGPGEYRTDPVYQPFVMYDSKQRVDEYGAMLDKNIISHRDAIDELRGVENPDEKIKEILEEKKIFGAAQPPIAAKVN